MTITTTTPSEPTGTKLIDVKDYLADCWCEINGGGIVTEDQLKEIESIRREVDG